MVDDLQIKITQNSQSAVKGIDALTNSLKKLKEITSISNVNFGKFAGQIKILSRSLQPLQGFKTQAGGLISALRHFKHTAEELNRFTGFNKFASQIKLLSESLQPLSGVGSKFGATLNALGQVSVISDQLGSVNFQPFAEKIVALTQALTPLSTIQSKLGSTLNQLTRFGQVAQQLNLTLANNDVSNNILTLTDALRPLTTINKSNIGSTLNQLKKLPEITNQLASIDMGAFANQINRAVAALKPLADEMNKISAGFKAFPTRIRSIITQNKRLSASNVATGESYGVLGTGIKSVYAKLGILVIGLRKVASVMSEWVFESNAYVENFNLFTVAMGEYADEAVEYARVVQDAMGIDMSEWIRNQGIFMQIATGFGVVTDKAYQMSKGLTQVAYDISSFFNIQIEDALTKVQSGISGELEPLRRLGYALDVATLQQVAYRHGIDMTVNKMTQAQKSQLRFIAIMDQSGNVMGDMARTLITPANALRILNQQLVRLKRALGDMIIPLLIKIIPYVQAFVKVLTNAAKTVASLFGFKLPEIDYSNLKGLSSGAGVAEDALGDVANSSEKAGSAANKANKAARKLKSTLMGFDELNILSSQNDPSSFDPAGDKSGGVGELDGLSGFDLGIDLSEYDYDFLGGLNTQVNELAKKIQKPFENALKLAGLIGITIASWKISNALYSLFTGKGTNAFFQGVRSLGKGFISPSGKTIKLASLLGNSTAYVSTQAVIAGIATTIGIIIIRFIDLVKNSERFRQGLSAIWDGLITGTKWVINTAIPAVGEFFANLVPTGLGEKMSSILTPIQGLLKALDIDSADWLLTLSSIVLLFTPAAPFAAAVLIFEGITLGIRALGWATSDAIEEIDILGEGISDTTKAKMQPFLDQMRDLDDTITSLDWGHVIIDQSIVDDVSAKVKAISKTIIEELDADANEALKNLDPLRDALGEEKYNKLITSNIAYYDELKQQVTDNEDQIIAIYQKAASENRKVTEDEQAEINRIRAGMNEIGVKHLSETEIEYQTIMNRLKDNSVRVSLEQAQGIMKNAREAKESTIEDAETQYAKVELEAQRMLNVGAINQGQYNDIIEAAKVTKEEAIKEANDQYTNIEDSTRTKLGSTAKYLDWETLNMRTNWGVAMGALGTAASEGLEAVEEFFVTKFGNILTWLSTNVFPKFTKEYWTDKFWGLVQGGQEALSALGKRFSNWSFHIKTPHFWWSYSEGYSASGTLKKLLNTVNLPTTIPKLKVSWYAAGGLPDIGELFVAREAGPELVGSIGGKSGVVNNDQIIEGVSQGVYKAVVGAMRVAPAGNGGGDIYVYIGNEQVDAYVQKSQDRKNIRSNGR